MCHSHVVVSGNDTPTYPVHTHCVAQLKYVVPYMLVHPVLQGYKRLAIDRYNIELQQLAAAKFTIAS